MKKLVVLLFFSCVSSFAYTNLNEFSIGVSSGNETDKTIQHGDEYSTMLLNIGFSGATIWDNGFTLYARTTLGTLLSGTVKEDGDKKNFKPKAHIEFCAIIGPGYSIFIRDDVCILFSTGISYSIALYKEQFTYSYQYAYTRVYGTYSLTSTDYFIGGFVNAMLCRFENKDKRGLFGSVGISIIRDFYKWTFIKGWSTSNSDNAISDRCTLKAYIGLGFGY